MCCLKRQNKSASKTKKENEEKRAKTEREKRETCLPGLLVISECIDAFSQAEQRGIDVSRLFQPFTFILCLSTSLWSSQITQRQPGTRVLLQTILKQHKHLAESSDQIQNTQTHSLTDSTLGIPTSSTFRIRTEKILWLKIKRRRTKSKWQIHTASTMLKQISNTK